MGSNEIKEWRFTVDLVKAMVQAPHESFARPVNSGVFWKPFPPGVNVQVQSGPQGHGLGVGGDPSRRLDQGRPPGQVLPGKPVSPPQRRQ